LIEGGSFTKVSGYLLAHPEVPLNSPNDRLQSPLQLASSTPASLPIVRMLLARGASPHYVVPGLNSTPLHAACASDSGHTAALLLAAGADPLRPDALGRTALHAAALHAGNSLLRRVLRATLHRVCAVAVACDKAGWLVHEEAPHATLVAAVNLATRDCLSGTPLHALLGNLALGAPGAGGGGKPASVGAGGPSAFTPPVRPAAAASAPAAAVAPTGYRTNLAPDAFRAIVADAFRALVNAQDVSGYSAIMVAAEHGRDETVKLLMGAGADPSLRNKLSHSSAEVRAPPPARRLPRAPHNTPARAHKNNKHATLTGGGLVRPQKGGGGD
jgi:hypothetical protein